MRYFRLFIILTFFFINSCDKEEFFSGQSEAFIKYFGSDKPFEGVQVLATDDGGYIILGNMENSNTHQDICIIRTDMYGNTISPIKVYGGNYDDFGYAIKKNDAGYIIAGSTKLATSSDKEIYLVQIDNVGDTLWTSRFGRNFDDEAYDVLVLDNQDIVIAGYTKRSENNSDVLIAKTNSLGQELLFEPQGLPDKNEIGNTIIMVGNYFIIGGSRTPSAENNSRSGYLVQLTSQGFTPLVVYLDTEGDSEVSSIVDAGNNTYFAACTAESPDRTESKINIVKFRHDDVNSIEILWMKEYGEQVFNQASYIRADNSSVSVAGTSGTNIESGDLLMMNIDFEGNSPEYTYTGDGMSFAGKGFDFTPDGGYIITGSNYSNENSVITLAKLNN